MEEIREFFSLWTSMEWILAFLVLWVSALIWSAIASPRINRHPKFEEVRDGGIALLSLLSGMAAVGLFVIGLKADIGPFNLLVLGLGAGSVGLSSLKIGEYRENAARMKQSRKLP